MKTEIRLPHPPATRDAVNWRRAWRPGTIAVVLTLLAGVVPAGAWGPHSQITQAALEVLGTNDALLTHLGAHAQRLTNYCWMGDYFGVVFEDADELFYADDYLLFPQAQRYFDHTGPDVRNALQPFYRRALQALRTENTANAARWVGALLHFIQDSGCPPHAAGLRGDVHSKMESWVETNQIRLASYVPRSLGESDEEVLEALLRNVERLIRDAEERGRRLRVAVEIGNRSAVRPVVLESALTCARLSADVLHSLGGLGRQGGFGNATLQGTISSAAPPGLERFPAKVVLQGTSFATLADALGRYSFRNLAPSNYLVLAFRAGNSATQKVASVGAGRTTTCDVALPKSDNVLLNGDFSLSAMGRSGPDYWYPTRSGWEGEPIPLKSGQRYRLTVQFKEGVRNAVAVRTLRAYEHAVPRFLIEPRFKSQTLTASERELILTGSPDSGLVHLTIRGRGAPASICERIVLTPIKRE